MIKFTPFPKIPRLSRECIITEKIDGTNASIWIEQVSGPENPFDMDADCFMGMKNGFYYAVAAASRSRFLTPEKENDNFGFAAWVRDNVSDLIQLGPGVHHGEWWGKGIQRGYGQSGRIFSLFNTSRWVSQHGEQTIISEEGNNPQRYAPECCHVVPVLFRGFFSTEAWLFEFEKLGFHGSSAAPGFMNPEGIMIYHTAARQYFKKTFEGDLAGKGQ